jgi:phosphatidate cytidylyltransferase
MLKQRIFTALILLAVLIPAVFYPSPEPFALVATVLLSAGAWEWGRLNQWGQHASLALGLVCGLGCVGMQMLGALHHSFGLVWTLSGAVWVLGGAWLLHAGSAGWMRVPQTLRVAVGLLALWVAWLAVVGARVVGINYLFSVLVLVWAADVFAYFAGRTLGGKFFRQKLAPSISPGKTWEGALGGLIGVMVCAWVWQYLDRTLDLGAPSLYSQLAQRGGPWTALALGFLVSMSVTGDLVESLFKRSAGVKDSSNLLPGHGGVLDRVDALLPVLPLCMMVSGL